MLVGTKDGLLQFGSRSRTHLAGHRITAIAVDRRHWWAAVDDRAIWRAGAGRRWVHVADSHDHAVTCLLPRPSGVLVGTESAHLLRLEGRALRRVDAFETADGRRRWYTPWGDPADVRSLAADRTGRVYVNVHVGGIVRSIDRLGGPNGLGSWEPTVDIEADVHQVLTHPDRPEIILLASAKGFGLSRDGGDTYEFATAGLHAHYLRAVAVAGEHELISASTGFHGRRSAIYRKRLDVSARFERCQAGLPKWFDDNIDTECLAALGSLAVFGTGDGCLYRSLDAGEHWALGVKGLPAIDCVAIG
jgi:hypothetical protein